MTELEQERPRYRPDPIRVLFIGESPPANGTFFYRGDSLLFKYTWKAFQEVYGPIDRDGFLTFFQGAGCYLDDLCLHPVNHLPRKERRCERRDAVTALAERIRQADPQAIVVVMRGIREPVIKAIERAGYLDRPREVLAFPAQGHQPKYVEGLATVLREWVQRGILPPPPGGRSAG